MEKTMTKRILGIVGSYRKNGVVDTLVSEALSAAKESGAEVEKIYLIDQHIEYCLNCRKCTQLPGEEPGKCVQDDDMTGILAKWKDADGMVLGAPVNFYNLTAVTRKFMERLIGFSYWPWNQPGPTMRTKNKTKKAVLITSTGMPAFLAKVFTGGPRALRLTADTMGAKTIASLCAGLIAQTEHPKLPQSSIRKACNAGRKLVTG